MSRSLYLIGAPGSGKSTVLDSVVSGLGLAWGPVEHPRRELDFNLLLDPDGVHLGLAWGVHREGGFPGTDALSQSVLPQALAYIRENPLPEYVLGEGQRLSTPKFLVYLDQFSPLTVVYLEADPELLANRRDTRPADKKVSDRNVKSWTTRARNAADTMRSLGFPVHTIDTGVGSPEDVAKKVQEVFVK